MTSDFSLEKRSLKCEVIFERFLCSDFLGLYRGGLTARASAAGEPSEAKRGRLERVVGRLLRAWTTFPDGPNKYAYRSASPRHQRLLCFLRQFHRYKHGCRVEIPVKL